MERKFTRKQALFYLGCATIGAIAGYELKQAKDPTPDNRLTISSELITIYNVDKIDNELENKSRELEPLEVDNISYIPLNGHIEPRYEVQSEELAQNGVTGFGLAVEIASNKLIVDVYTPDNVQFKTPFKGYSGWIFSPAPEGPSSSEKLLVGNSEKGNFKGLRILFGTKIQKLYDKEFAVVINAGLLNVDGNDIPAFLLPYMFTIVKPASPEKTGSLNI